MNVIATKFADSPAMIAGHMAAWAGECLQSISGFERVEELMNAPEMMGDSFWLNPEEDWRAVFRPYTVVEGTLLVPVKGLMLHDFPWQLGSMATGYPYIAKAIERGLADPNVQRIALVINSGGGEVAGNFDLVDRIHAASKVKPMAALVNEHAYSAAYSIASAAGKIFVPRTGGVGSIGVVTSHLDVSGYYDKLGVKMTFVHAGKHKVDGNPYEPLPEDVKNRMQARIDGLYNVFVSTVARNLSISEEVVRGTEALTFSAQDAIEIGLAHSVSSFDEALAAFNGGTTATVIEEVTMSTTEQTQAASAAELEAARAEGITVGAKAERERIQGILALDEAASRRTQAFNIAMKTELTVEAAKDLLASFPEEKVEAAPAAKPAAHGEAFENAMSNTPNPEVGADGGQKPEQLSAVDQIMADMRAFTGETKH